jgi:hypothetical protein
MALKRARPVGCVICLFIPAQIACPVLLLIRDPLFVLGGNIVVARSAGADVSAEIPDKAQHYEGSSQKTESMVTPVFATPILTTSWLA